MDNTVVRLRTVDGVVYASSRHVAQDFRKDHRHVLRDIEELKTEISPNVGRSWFRDGTYFDTYNRQQPCIDMTRQGWSLVVMNYRGMADWKVAYIQKFDEMEGKLGAGAKTEGLWDRDKPSAEVIQFEGPPPAQRDLFAPTSPSIGDAHLDVIAGPPSKPGGFNEIEWHEHEAGVEYSVIKSVRRNGAPMSLFFSRIGISHVATEAVFWVPDASGNGDQVGLYLNHVIPLAVVERAIDRLGIGPMSQLTHNTLQHYLAF